MHPALSVIFFTTLSGAGYGLLAWLGLHYAWRPLPLSAEFALVPFALGLVLATVGLLCSVGHLGQPQRAWRAFSQWRSSWLSREGVLAALTYAPALGLAALVWRGEFDAFTRLLGVLLALCSLATVACTAMIYVSLTPIPAWRDARVLPAYLGFAALGGALLLMALFSLTGWSPSRALALAVAASALVLGALKWSYWRALDRIDFSDRRAAATGLEGFGSVRTFERPHTETSFVTREMAFVLARKHARRLRAIALVLFAALPTLFGLLLIAWPGAAGALLFAAVAAVLAGSFVERWLFFAEARHLVTLYF